MWRLCIVCLHSGDGDDYDGGCKNVSAADDDDLRGKEGWMRKKEEKCCVMHISIRGERRQVKNIRYARKRVSESQKHIKVSLFAIPPPSIITARHHYHQQTDCWWVPSLWQMVEERKCMTSHGKKREESAKGEKRQEEGFSPTTNGEKAGSQRKQPAEPRRDFPSLSHL